MRRPKISSGGKKRGDHDVSPHETSHTSTDPQDLNDLLLKLSSQDRPFTMRNALDHEVVFGGVGSGKTIGSCTEHSSDSQDPEFGGVYLCPKLGDLEFPQSSSRLAEVINPLIVGSHDDAATAKRGQSEVARQSLKRK